jgi:Subtilisin inhibitor-like
VNVLALAVTALALASGGTAAPTDLRITVWPEGPEHGGAQVWRLRCDPAGGTLPRAATACRRLAALERPFAPVPKDAACTQVFGGPEVARVVGTFRGRRVWVTFRRRDGCEIDRWNRHRFLFPGATGPR